MAEGTTARALAALLAAGIAHACALDLEGRANIVSPPDGSAGAGGAGGSLMLDGSEHEASAGQAGAAEASAGSGGGSCGSYAEPCCAGAAPCTQGACLDGVCSELGGAYVSSIAPECAPAPCANPNTHASGLCACPAGFIAQTMPIVNDCWMPGISMGAELTFCRASTAYADSDWAGAFQLVPPNTPCTPSPVDGCNVPNPYTNACNCPDGTIPMALPVDVPVCNNTSQVQGTIVLCWNGNAPRASFESAFLLDDPPALCAIPHPTTSDCKCPTGDPTQGLRMLRNAGGQLRGTTLLLCEP